MPKKKYDLTSEIVTIESGEQKKFDSQVDVKNTKTIEKQRNVLMTISVEEDQRREFKAWCAKNGMKMNEAFLKGFALLKATTNNR